VGVKQDEFLQFPQAHGRIMSKIEKKVKSFFGGHDSARRTGEKRGIGEDPF
jgi:hypothetical protein